MNNRRRRLAKLADQELAAAKNKFEQECGVAVGDAIEILKQFARAIDNIAEESSEFLSKKTGGKQS